MENEESVCTSALMIGSQQINVEKVMTVLCYVFFEKDQENKWKANDGGSLT